jgi:hypothetical protein
MPRTTTIPLILCRAADAFPRSLRAVRAFFAALALLAAFPAAAHAQYRCLGDFSGSLDDTPDAPLLRFGMYPGGSAGQVGPVGLPAEPEDAAKREAALATVRPATSTAAPRDFVVHLYRHFTADQAMEEQEKEADAAVARYTSLGYLVEYVVRYMPRDEDPAVHVPEYVEFLRGMVRRYGSNPRFVALQVTNEANFPGSPDTSDGAFEGAKDALIQGVIAVDGEARKLGFEQLEAGFNWFYRMPDDVEYPFWEYLRDVGGPAFVAALDWVGVDAYPGTFFPPSSNSVSKRNALINAFDVLRDCFLPIPEIPDTTPIHVTENGYPTGPGRSYETQRDSLEEMIRAVHDARGTYNVTDHRWFNLRDADSESPNFQQQYGLLRDDYTPKPAFETYDRLVEELARTEPPAPVVQLRVRPRRAWTGRRTRFRFTVVPRRRGVVVRFAGARRETGRRGRAKVVRRFARRGPRRATARLEGWGRARATVRVR